MKLEDLVNETFGDTETVVILDEGLFSVSPVVAAIAFKDSVFQKGKDAIQKNIKDPVSNAAGAIAVGAEKLKAKTIGKSGNKDDDTVYSLTKEQRKVMAYIYRKYGAEMVNKISDFRNDVMPSYNLLKRTLAKTKMLNNKEIFGMTKEDYYKYRESGRKKIEKKGTYSKDFKDLREKQTEARIALNKAKKTLEDFKAGKMADLSASNIEKIFDLAGIGRKKQNGWSDVELEKTFTKIKELEGKLKNSNLYVNGNPDEIRVFGRSNGKKAETMSREAIEFQIKRLKESGVSSVSGKKSDDEGHHGSFADALNIYLLRKEKQKELKQNSLPSEYKKFYEQVLKDAISSAEKIYEEKFTNFMAVNNSVDLNEFENKIWGCKLTGKKYSGDINQWYLKIKPEDFIETKYYKKNEKIIKAEQEFDRLLKRLERDLKKVMSDEDIALCKKYRLFNNFLTIKELKDPANMFKGDGDFKNLKTSEDRPKENIEDRLDSALSKEFNSIRELEAEQDKIKDLAKNENLSGETAKKYKEFMSRINPKKGSTSTKIGRAKLSSLFDEIIEKSYTGKTEASEDMKRLEDAVDDYKEVNGEEDFKQFNYDYNQAKSKLVAFLKDGDK